MLNLPIRVLKSIWIASTNQIRKVPLTPKDISQEWPRSLLGMQLADRLLAQARKEYGRWERKCKPKARRRSSR